MTSIRRRAYFIDATYTIRDGKTYVILVVKGKVTSKLYYQHDPYFIVQAPLEKKDDLLAIKARRRNGTDTSAKAIEEIELQIGLTKKKMLKFICHEPSDVPLFKELIPYPLFENNIPFARRFLFDMNITPLHILTYERQGPIITKFISITAGEPKLNALAFDIETYNPLGMPNEEKDPAVMISYAGQSATGLITYKKTATPKVEQVDSEKSMLERFCAIVKEQNPDVIFGYNSSLFDLPYLRTRSSVTKSAFDIGRYPGGMKDIDKGNIKGMKLNGRTHFDIFPLVKFFSFIGLIKTQSMSLDSVSEDVLGKRKVKIGKEDIWKMWDAGTIDKLCEYALVDAELTYELGMRFLSLEMELSSVAKMPLFETTLSTSGQLVENLLMYYASQKKMLIPSKPAGADIDQRLEAPIQGAFVKLPEPGIYENMAVLDFRGLYPSIIISYNIDPGTLLPQEGVNEALYYESPSGAKFSKSEKGLVPFVLDFLVEMRGHIKDEVKKLDKSSLAYERMSARSHALKILANSFYGYLGYARSRWYSRPCAESVTAWGRKHISDTIETAEKSGFQVLYADTDSVFIIYKNKEDVLKFMDKVNESLPDKMELELEGFYTRGVFVSKKGANDEEGTGAKKKYALLGEDGRIKIRGFELVRRDWSKVAKETQKKVLEAILKEGSKEKAVKIIRETIALLNSGKVPLEDLAISTQISKDPKSYDIVSPETSAAKKLIAAGTRVEKGSIISYVLSRGGKTISEKATPLELAKDYDADYYINNQLLPAVMKIMKELGYDEYSMKVGGKQTGLDSFF